MLGVSQSCRVCVQGGEIGQADGSADTSLREHLLQRIGGAVHSGRVRASFTNPGRWFTGEVDPTQEDVVGNGCKGIHSIAQIIIQRCNLRQIAISFFRC